MTEATTIPAHYERFTQCVDSFQSFNAGDSIPASFVDAAKAGWTVVYGTVNVEDTECCADIQDSLKSLEEGKGISLEDLRGELGV